MFWVSALRQYSPGEVLNIFIYRLRRESPNLKHSSFTALTTGVSNPFRYQRLRPSTSVFTWNDDFAFSGPASINRFHPYSCNSSVPLLDSSKSVQYFFCLIYRFTDPLDPFKINNACLPRFTATAGTWFGRDLSKRYRHHPLFFRALSLHSLHPSR